MSPSKKHVGRVVAAAACAAIVGAALPVVLSAQAEPPKEGFLPDPPVSKSTKHWVFDIDVKAGVVSLGKARAATTPKPEGTPRVMGRYALELYSGRELLDRARFNVPGMGDGVRDDKRVLKRPTMTLITTKFAVRIADNPRANWARVVDRATGDEVYISWPPDEQPTAADAGPAASGSASSAPAASAPPVIVTPALPPGAYMTDAGFIVDPPSTPPSASAKPKPSASAPPPADAGPPVKK